VPYGPRGDRSPGQESGSVQEVFPVRRNSASWTRSRLIWRVRIRRSELGPLFYEFIGLVIVEPGLTGLEAADKSMPGSCCVLAGVLRRRVVAATDVSADNAAPEVEPPTALSEALHAPCAAGRNGEVNVAEIHFSPDNAMNCRVSIRLH
jgi:hypothetical protein